MKRSIYTIVPCGLVREAKILTDEEFGRLIRALLRNDAGMEVLPLPGAERFFWEYALRSSRLTTREKPIWLDLEDRI